MIRPDSRAWFPIVTGLSTAVVIAFFSYIGLSSTYLTVSSSIMSAILFVIIDWFTDKLMKSAKFRPIIDPKRSKFEGEWLEYFLITDNNGNEYLNYAYFRIRYTGKDGEPYLIKGSVYDRFGTLTSRWSSTMAKFDSSRGLIDYFYIGYSFERGFDGRGFANLSFDDKTFYVKTDGDDDSHPHKTVFKSGSGFFVDSSAGGTLKGNFQFIKIDSAFAKNVMCDKNTEDIDAERCFVINFHNIYGESIIKNGFWSAAP